MLATTLAQTNFFYVFIIFDLWIEEKIVTFETYVKNNQCWYIPQLNTVLYEEEEEKKKHCTKTEITLLSRMPFAVG